MSTAERVNPTVENAPTVRRQFDSSMLEVSENPNSLTGREFDSSTLDTSREQGGDLRPSAVSSARHTTNGGGRSNWRTPRDLFQRMDDRWRFTYDAFAGHSNALCETYSTADGTFRCGVPIDSLDGLRQDWSRRRVFMNPPYTRGFIGAAVEKASSVKDEAQIIVALLPENRDTIWWRSFVKNQAAVYSIGRVKFIDPVTGNPGGSPPGGSAVVIWTPDWLDR